MKKKTVAVAELVGSYLSGFDFSLGDDEQYRGWCAVEFFIAATPHLGAPFASIPAGLLAHLKQKN